MLIHGLTLEHVIMMDIMYSLQTRQDLTEWRSTLSAEDRRMSQTLEYLMVFELIDEMDDSQYELADAVIDQFRLA
jgi:hypothetical protein